MRAFCNKNVAFPLSSCNQVTCSYSLQRKCRQMLCVVFSAKRPYLVEGMGMANATIEFYFLDVYSYTISTILRYFNLCSKCIRGDETISFLKYSIFSEGINLLTCFFFKGCFH